MLWQASMSASNGHEENCNWYTIGLSNQIFAERHKRHSNRLVAAILELEVV